ncbi:MAG: DUF4465 domain-containing protein, partial [Deltaproteobacteria bacterium]|nr:DUF4465 domain-containing protein [Deltaproteobacteria bacterium]
SLAPETYYNGSDKAGGFSSGGADFNNMFDDTYGAYWEGFAYSNTTDTTTSGYTNESSAIAGSGEGSSTIYGVAYQGYQQTVPTITFDDEVSVASCYITNTTYAYLAIRDGYFAAKKFGGDTGDDPDYFLLTITGKDMGGNTTGTVAFYLADYRFADNAEDYIVDDWTLVDLKSLGDVKSIEFSLSSSDNDLVFGMNTPAYFAIDSIQYGQAASGNEGVEENGPHDGDDGGQIGCFIDALDRALY